MVKRLSAEDYFKIVEDNYNAYINANAVTHLSYRKMESKKEIVKTYNTFIQNYRQSYAAYLDDLITETPVTTKIEEGLFSVLLGAIVGGGFFGVTQLRPSVDFMGIKSSEQAAFSIILGASFTAIAGGMFELSNEKPLNTDTEDFIAQLDKAGFSNKKFAHLSGELVKLFHFRECLLLDLPDTKAIKMREAFKRRYFSSATAEGFNDDDFNLAIEDYFLSQLNNLFNTAFTTIHQQHEQELEAEEKLPSFLHWFKSYFTSDEVKSQFTQKMQLVFLDNCVKFLDKEMSEPSYIGQYIYLFDILSGMIAGALTLGLLAVFNPIIHVIALVCIGLAAACVMGVIVHLLLLQDSLMYARDSDNREAIRQTIESIGQEQKRLTLLIENIVPTSEKNIQDLDAFDEENTSFFFKCFNITEQDKHPAFGSARAWAREYASRYRDNITIDVDLSQKIKEIMGHAYEQDDLVQPELIAFAKNRTPPFKLVKLIKHTRAYLLLPERAPFIRTFNLVQKIKEQVLELVGSIEPSNLPACLKEFYTDSLEKGGLNGLPSDLKQASRLAPVVSSDLTPDSNHPYYHILDCAYRINLKLSTANSPTFKGDKIYREKLGLSVCREIYDTTTLTVDNLNAALDASFVFLCSLNQYKANYAWDTPFANHDEYIIYRMLLIKQLATLSDPNNLRVEPLLKEQINTFAHEKLNYDPSTAFTDVRMQTILLNAQKDPRLIADPLDNTHAMSDLIDIVNAIRVDMAHDAPPLCAKHLVEQEAVSFLKKDNTQLLFGYNTKSQLIPESTDAYLARVNRAISQTKSFLNSISQRDILSRTNSIPLYYGVINQEIESTIKKIEHVRTAANASSFYLPKAILALQAFQQTFQTLLPPAPPSITDLKEITAVITELEGYNTKKEGKNNAQCLPHFSFFTSRAQKMTAAINLVQLLQQKVDLSSDEDSKVLDTKLGTLLKADIYKKSKGLREILTKHSSIFPQPPVATAVATSPATTAAITSG